MTEQTNSKNEPTPRPDLAKQKPGDHDGHNAGQAGGDQSRDKVAAGQGGQGGEPLDPKQNPKQPVQPAPVKPYDDPSNDPSKQMPGRKGGHDQPGQQPSPSRG